MKKKIEKEIKTKLKLHSSDKIPDKEHEATFTPAKYDNS